MKITNFPPKIHYLDPNELQKAKLIAKKLGMKLNEHLNDILTKSNKKNKHLLP